MRYMIIMGPADLTPAHRYSDLVADIARLAGLPLRYACCGITILGDPDLPISLIGDRGGLVIGHIYSRRRGAAVHDLAELADSPVTATDAAQFLLKGCWGAYVACLQGTRDNNAVLRDPSSQLPCYYVQSKGIAIFASDAPLLVDCGLIATDIDPAALARFLLYPEFREPTTCLVGIAELMGGELAAINSHGLTRTQLWNPWDHTHPAVREDSEEAAFQLANVINTTIGYLASPYRHIMVDVSGGLDSSIVAASLRAARRDFQCLTMYTDDPSGDERSYAQMIADHLAVPLHARMYEADQVSVMHAGSYHLPRPNMKMFKQAIASVHADYQQALGVDAIFGGNGGDNIFCYLHSSAPVTDRILAEGLFSSWPQTANDVSTITGASLFTIARQAIGRLSKGRRAYSWAPDTRLLASAVVDSMDVASHPWLSGGADRPFGKTAHIALWLRAQNHLEGYPCAQNLPVINPMLAQPVVEACLAVPTWQWCEGGINRSLARRAFADRLPEKVQRRISKSGPDSFIHRVFQASRSDITPFLCDGILAEMTIIDVPAVEAALNAPPPNSQLHHRLLMLCDAEAWCRSWSDRRPVGRRGG